MIVINLKMWSWIIATIIFLVYNIGFNRSSPGIDVMPLFRGGLSVILYLIFWMVWLIATR